MRCPNLDCMTSRTACGWGLAHITTDDAPTPARVLDTWFPWPALGTANNAPCPEQLSRLTGHEAPRVVRTEVVKAEIDLDAPPADVPDAYLRLHLLSHRLVLPNTVNLDGLFGVLPNVVWTNFGPCDAEGFEETRMRLRPHGHLEVFGVDKFPRMTDYVVPTGVRIAEADRIGLGAYLAEGTTVMPEGFVNFNAGTLGAAMIEGRISQGVTVGEGTDVGGGASTMGTLSGGGHQRVSIGERCLIGAEAGIGIALGDDCVVEAGLYLTAGTKVTLDNGRVVPARELSGASGLRYLRHSVTGAVVANTRSGHGIDLNSELHVHG